MDAEPEQLDAREAKVLADILALVLQDEPGASAAALEALRRKARQNRITGGALKNLFQSVAAQVAGEIRPHLAFSDTPAGALDRLKATNRTLEKALAAANGEAARLQSELDQVQARLLEAHQFNRGLAERWRAVRKKASLLAAGMTVCVVVISGLLVERLVARSPAPQNKSEPTLGWQSKALPSEPGTPPTPAEPSTAARADEATAAGAASERDPDLEQALRRLSNGSGAPDGGEAAGRPAGLPGSSPVPAHSGYLPPDVYSGIITHVRTCWRTFVGQLGDAHFQARLQVIADESGVVREAKLAPEEMSQLSDPAFQNFVRAAMRSVLDPNCAQLPIPPARLGRKIAFDFVFVP